MMRSSLRQLSSLLANVGRQQPAFGEGGSIVLLPPQMAASGSGIRQDDLISNCQVCQSCRGGNQYYSTNAMVASSTPSSGLQQQQGALVRISPQNRVQQLQIKLDGKQLRGVPGAYKYTAPYLLPDELRQGVPRVLLADPWVSLEDRKTIKTDLQRLLAFMRQRMDQPMRPPHILRDFNQQAHQAGQQPLPGIGYTARLLETLRNNRFIIGKKNLNSPRPAGHPDHSYFYVALPYQAEHKGAPSQVAQRLEKKRQDWVKLGLARVRRGKPPFPIHRPVANTSVYQHALGYEAMYHALEQQQQQQLQEGSSAGGQQQ